GVRGRSTQGVRELPLGQVHVKRRPARVSPRQPGVGNGYVAWRTEQESRRHRAGGGAVHGGVGKAWKRLVAASRAHVGAAGGGGGEEVVRECRRGASRVLLGHDE